MRTSGDQDDHPHHLDPPHTRIRTNNVLRVRQVRRERSARQGVDWVGVTHTVLFARLLTILRFVLLSFFRPSENLPSIHRVSLSVFNGTSWVLLIYQDSGFVFIDRCPVRSIPPFKHTSDWLTQKEFVNYTRNKDESKNTKQQQEERSGGLSAVQRNMVLTVLCLPRAFLSVGLFLVVRRLCPVMLSRVRLDAASRCAWR